MKYLLLFSLLFPSSLVFSQNQPYSVSSYHEEGNKAPNTHYIGEAWLNGVLQADDLFNYNITKATFKANSTLDWHKHTGPQILIVVEGEGYYQEKGKEPIRIQLGDILKCSPGIEHWHASSKEKDITYLAIYNGGTEWTEVLTQEAYDRVAESLKKQ